MKLLEEVSIIQYYKSRLIIVNKNKDKAKLMNSCLKNQLNGMYNTESARMRKKIRLLDLELMNDACVHRKNLNFLVLGPYQTGKKCLLRTLNYSLNILQRCPTQQITQNGITYEKYDLKKGNRVKVEGLSSLRETDRKISISGYKLKSNCIDRANQFLRNLPNNQNRAEKINLVIICISADSLLSNEDINWVGDIVETLTEIQMDFIVVGTKVDKILSDQINELLEDKSLSIGNWRDYIKGVLRIRSNKDIYCLENYKKQDININSSQQINFYALALLDRCLQKIEEKKAHKHFFNFKCFSLF